MGCIGRHACPRRRPDLLTRRAADGDFGAQPGARARRVAGSTEGTLSRVDHDSCHAIRPRRLGFVRPVDAFANWADPRCAGRRDDFRPNRDGLRAPVAQISRYPSAGVSHDFRRFLRLDLAEDLALLSILGRDDLGFEADRARSAARRNDLLEASERAAAHEQDIGSVDLQEFLLRVLTVTLRWYQQSALRQCVFFLLSFFRWGGFLTPRKKPDDIAAERRSISASRNALAINAILAAMAPTNCESFLTSSIASAIRDLFVARVNHLISVFPRARRRPGAERRAYFGISTILA